MTDNDQFQPTNLDDLLPDDDAPTQAAPAAPEPAQETGEQDAAPPQEAEAQDAPPASDPEPAGRMVPVAALEDERRKRQQLEQYLYDLQQQQQPQAQQNPEDLSNQFWDDPTGYLNNAVSHAASQLQQRHQAEIFETRAELSREVMRAAHQDYEEVEAVFLQAVEKDPTLAMKLGQSKNPAKFAYEEGQKLKLVQDPDAYRAKIEAEVLAKYGIQPGGQPARKAPPAPPSLAGVPSANVNPTNEFAGPTPLSSLIPD